MRVVVRVRPFTREESGQLDDQDTRTIQLSGRIKQDNRLLVCRGTQITYTREDLKSVRNTLQRHEFTYDMVLDQTTDQRGVFEATSQPLVPRLLKGYNATVFAYGATGCGKTFTMFGNELGIVNQTIAAMLKVDEPGFAISMSYLEVYNEQLRDLIPSSADPSASGQTSARRESGAQYKSYRIASESHFVELLRQGAARRKVSATFANNTSSRSHAVLKFALTLAGGKTATLTFVDLAGSERASKHNDGSRFLEGTQINKSLLALGSCINALAQKKKFVPYRDSTLTRVLQPSLSGNSLLVMVACVSPSNAHSLETLSTLKYATTARTIRSSPQPAPAPSSRHQLTQQLAEYEQRVSKLTNDKRALEAELSSCNARIAGLDTGISLIGAIYSRRVGCWYEAEAIINADPSFLNLNAETKESVREILRDLMDLVQTRTSPLKKRQQWHDSPEKKRVRWSTQLEHVREHYSELSMFCDSEGKRHDVSFEHEF